MGFLGDVFLEDLGLGGLRVAEIHHLVEELVDDDEVVPDGFFLELLEVFGEDLHDLVEKEEDLGGICVSFGEGKEVEVVVSDIEVLERKKAVSATLTSSKRIDCNIRLSPRRRNRVVLRSSLLPHHSRV